VISTAAAGSPKNGGVISTAGTKPLDGGSAAPENAGLDGGGVY